MKIFKHVIKKILQKKKVFHHLIKLMLNNPIPKVVCSLVDREETKIKEEKRDKNN
jgi:hypothetical protein